MQQTSYRNMVAHTHVNGNGQCLFISFTYPISKVTTIANIYLQAHLSTVGSISKDLQTYKVRSL